MSLPTENIEFPQLIFRLTDEQKKNPFTVLQGFFYDTDLPEVRGLFEKILETCMTTDDGPFGKAKNRDHLLSMLRKIEQILEANYLIFVSRKNSLAQ